MGKKRMISGQSAKSFRKAKGIKLGREEKVIRRRPMPAETLTKLLAERGPYVNLILVSRS